MINPILFSSTYKIDDTDKERARLVEKELCERLRGAKYKTIENEAGGGRCLYFC